MVVSDASASALVARAGRDGGPERLVTLTSVEDDRYDEQLQVLWVSNRRRRCWSAPRCPGWWASMSPCQKQV